MSEKVEQNPEKIETPGKVHLNFLVRCIVFNSSLATSRISDECSTGEAHLVPDGKLVSIFGPVRST